MRWIVCESMTFPWHVSLAASGYAAQAHLRVVLDYQPITIATPHASQSSPESKDATTRISVTLLLGDFSRRAALTMFNSSASPNPELVPHSACRTALRILDS
jgi:hypothetical protein